MKKRGHSQSPATPHKRQASITSTESSTSSLSNTSSDTETRSFSPSHSLASSTSSSQASTTISGSTVSRDSLVSEETKTSPQPNIQTFGRKNDLDKSETTVVASTRLVGTGLATPQTMRDSSHDGTVISPYVANGFKYTASMSLAHYTPTESFPVLKAGNVFIKTDLVSPSKQWQLQSDVLARHSPWFARSMQEPSNEDGPLTWFLYTIEEVNGKVDLVHQQANGGRPTIEVCDGSIVQGIPIKVEDAEDALVSVKKTSLSTVLKNEHAPVINLYNQIFGSFYSIPPPISTNSINTALSHAEKLIKIADTLGCLHLLTSHIGNALLQYRQELFVAIKADPARWLLLAQILQNDSIYTEALIHLSGAHPCWPWPTKRSALPEEIRRLIATKFHALDQMCLEAERELLLLTIHIHNNTPVQPEENSQFHTWFIVAYFRDILARELHTLENDRKKSLIRGKVYRKIRQGGSAYMDYGVMRRSMERVMPSAVDNLSEDLAMLKEYASEYVKGLAENQLMLDVEAHGVGYLTCTRVEKGDIPWRAGGQSGA